MEGKLLLFDPSKKGIRKVLNSSKKTYKIDLWRQLKNIDGTPLWETDAKGNKAIITLEYILTKGLLNVEDKVKTEDKLYRYQIAKKFAKPQTILGVQTSNEVELTREEIDYIKKTIGEMFKPIIVGPVFEIFDEIK